MSTVAEIEAALPELSEEELRRVEAAIHRVQSGRSAKTAAAEAKYHDLDPLIGSWKDDPEFDAAIRAFEQVDDEHAK